MIFLLIFAPEYRYYYNNYAHEEIFLDCYVLIVVGSNVM